jgi:murein DD-endopeptidase MepM/ murein hydrolase activator NlpD
MSALSNIPLITPGGGGVAGGAIHGVPIPAVVRLPPERIGFPFHTWHMNDFRHGGCSFGAPRPAKGGGHRAHAAVDLLAPRGTPLYAIADGFVRQSPYYFYEGTNAIELVFPGVGVARYGEVDLHQDPPFRTGHIVKKGDLVGHVGRLNSGSSMLHFELYQGREPSRDVADFDHDPLTQTALRPFQRHPNLTDPTQLMWALYERTLGAH